MLQLTSILGNFVDLIREGSEDILHNLTGTAATTNGDATVTGTGTQFTTELAAGDTIKIGSVTGTIDSISSNTSLELTANAGATVAATAFYKQADASQDARPADLDSQWEKIGDVEDAQFEPKLDTEEVMTPSESGGYVRKGKFTKQATLDFSITTNDMNNLIFELALQTGEAVEEDTAAVPMAGDGMVRGWFRVRQRKLDGTVINRMFVWAELSIGNLKVGNAVPKPALTISVLKNDLNKTTLNLAA